MSNAADSLTLDVEFDCDQLAVGIANTWMTWDMARQPQKNKWNELRQYLHATSTNETINSTNGHSHSTHIPKLTQIRDNLHANYMFALFPNDDWLTFEGDDRDGASALKKRVVLAYINNKHRLSKFKNTISRLILDWIDYGNCFAHVFYENEFHIDPDTQEIIPGFVGPQVRRISPFDIVFNPLATDFKRSPKIVRCLKSIGELHRDVEEKPELGYSKVILDKMMKLRAALRQSTAEQIDKTMQMQFDGLGNASQYYNQDFVEILEFYGDMFDHHGGKFYKNHVITVVDRRWLIRSEPCRTWTGVPNIFHCGWRLRSDNLWAMGPLENLVGMQYLINHLENSRADAFDQMLQPTRVLVGNVEEQNVEEGKPGGRFTIPDGDGSVQNLLPDTTVLNADLQIQRLMSLMEEFAGSPREAMGFRTPGEKTAFEVDSLQNAASRIFDNKTNYFNLDFVEQIVNAQLETSKRNMNAPDVVKIIDDDLGVAEFMQITKADITANGKLVPIGARHFARDNQLIKNLQGFGAMLQADEMLAQHFPSSRLAKVLENLLGFEKFGLYEKFGRIPEMMEQQRLTTIASEEAQLEDSINVGDDEAPLVN